MTCLVRHTGTTFPLHYGWFKFKSCVQDIVKVKVKVKAKVGQHDIVTHIHQIVAKQEYRYFYILPVTKTVTTNPPETNTKQYGPKALAMQAKMWDGK